MIVASMEGSFTTSGKFAKVPVPEGQISALADAV